MDIDCSTCPGRDHACDGCVMTVLFGPLTSENTTATRWQERQVTTRGGDAEIVAAIDTFTRAAMVSSADARSARAAIRAVQPGDPGTQSPTLRAG